MSFRFKQFSVRNDAAALRVNTDAVLLGAACTVHPADGRVLDAGTGNGTVALMVAQRLAAVRNGFRIRGIDIDPASVREAAANFADSPWAPCLSADLCSLAEASGDEPYDLIVSNPPYFEDSLRNPDARKAAARHAEELSYKTLTAFAADRLSPDGRLALILPAEQEAALLQELRFCGLVPQRVLRIRTTAAKPPKRIVAECGRIVVERFREEELVMQEKGRYTEAYTDLVRDFYLWA